MTDLEDWRVWRGKFKENFELLLPQEIREDVSLSHEAYGQIVYWYYETERGIGVACDSDLEDNQFVSMGHSEVHDDGHVVPTDTLRENFSRPIYEGLRAAFVANPEMLEGKKKSVYLITESQENDLLQNREGADGLRDVINTTPQFLSTPR